MRKSDKSLMCPCGSHLALVSCCQRFIDGIQIPETALELMRSRYTAYVLADDRYLKKTWYPGSRPGGNIVTKDHPVKWTRLEILRHEEDQHDAIIEFIASCKLNGRAQKMHETSRFIRESGQWYYLDGSFTKDK